MQFGAYLVNSVSSLSTSSSLISPATGRLTEKVRGTLELGHCGEAVQLSSFPIFCLSNDGVRSCLGYGSDFDSSFTKRYKSHISSKRVQNTMIVTRSITHSIDTEVKDKE